MKIIIAGDYCPRYKLKNIIEEGDYSQVFDGIKGIVSMADYAIVNLECPIINGDERAIAKSGPSLGNGIKVLEAIKYAGFTCVTLANNHFNDYGKEGCLNTFASLKKVGLDYVGAGRNLEEASDFFLLNHKVGKIAIINMCENEFSIAATDTPGSNPLDPISVFYQFSEAKKKADKIIVIVHGGNEHYDYPSPRMKRTYRWFIDMGADVVVNHHQHCYSGYEIYNNHPIVYGLGNFCFDKADKKHSKWQEGYMVGLDIKEGGIDIECIPYIQCRDNYSVSLLSDNQRGAFDKKINSINAVISNDSLLDKTYNEFMDSEMWNKKLCLVPYNNKILKYACKRGYLPSFISRQRKLFVLDHVQCESLRDVFLYYLKH